VTEQTPAAKSTKADASIESAEVLARAEAISPAFKLVFLTVLGITLLALAMNAVLVVTMNDPNEQAKSLIETCSTMTKAGFGAIIGLIGGKALPS
jgi:hypothetical protein